jgi:hypothetical protein
MRVIFAAFVLLCAGACTALTGGNVTDLAPVYANPMAHNGRTFLGEVYIVVDRSDPGIYRLSQTEDGAQWFGLQSGAQQRLQDWYHMRPGHRFLARGLLRPTACGEAGTCAETEPRFLIMNLQILRRPGQ